MTMYGCCTAPLPLLFLFRLFFFFIFFILHHLHLFVLISVYYLFISFENFVLHIHRNMICARKIQKPFTLCLCHGCSNETLTKSGTYISAPRLDHTFFSPFQTKLTFYLFGLSLCTNNGNETE